MVKVFNFYSQSLIKFSNYLNPLKLLIRFNCNDRHQHREFQFGQLHQGPKEEKRCSWRAKGGMEEFCFVQLSHMMLIVGSSKNWQANRQKNSKRSKLAGHPTRTSQTRKRTQGPGTCSFEQQKETQGFQPSFQRHKPRDLRAFQSVRSALDLQDPVRQARQVLRRPSISREPPQLNSTKTQQRAKR